MNYDARNHELKILWSVLIYIFRQRPLIRCSEPTEMNYISNPSTFSWIRYFTPSSISPAFIINSAETYVCNDNNVINFDSDMRFGFVYIGQKNPEGYKAGGRNCGSSDSPHSKHSWDLIPCLYNRMRQRRILWLRDRIKRAYSDKSG